MERKGTVKPITVYRGHNDNDNNNNDNDENML